MPSTYRNHVRRNRIGTAAAARCQQYSTDLDGSNTLAAMHVLVINGPNLNLLGTRQPDIYGLTTLSQLEELIAAWGHQRDIEVSCYQSNHEGEIIDRLHAARGVHDGLVINAGALTHYSYALHDAIVATELPAVEVHISNVRHREPWRRTSVIEPACVYSIFGRGLDGYRYALDYLVNRTAMPFETYSYGPAEDQIADLRVPGGPGRHPVAVLIHGGFWRDHWLRDSMDPPAIDLTRRGWATWNLEYHRVGSGGGWPVTLEDIANGIDHLAVAASDHPLDLDRVVAIGHSAGGQLALWSAVRPHLSDGIPDPSTRVEIRGVLALAAVSDLRAGHADGVGRNAVEEFLRRAPDDGPERYAAADPATLVPLGVPQILIHGASDDAVPVQMSRDYVAAATAAGDRITYEELPEIGHMELIDPGHDAWRRAAALLDDLA
ncbi:MAG: type II 3-dehydroquinate dehydratase [Acidimicrobiia bacterium]|nr:type II 3-dehydroquinate dehydratase [Acidimicrobiia bacterium]